MTDHIRPFRAEAEQDATTLIDEIDRRRKEQGISQAALARTLGTTQSDISETFTRRTKSPRLPRAAELARAVGARITIDDSLYHLPTVALERPEPADVVPRATLSALGASLMEVAAAPDFYTDRTLTIAHPFAEFQPRNV